MRPENSNPHPRRWAAAILPVAACLLVLVACGRKGDPEPPLRFIPESAKDLRVRQQGAELVLDFAYPARTVAGSALPELSGMEVWHLRRPTTAEGQAPELDPREFAGAGEIFLDLEPEAFGRAVAGDRVVLRQPLPAPLGEAYFFAVRTRVGKRDISAFSNLVAIVPLEAPAPPGELSVLPNEKGIEVSWQAPADDGAAGYNIYRRNPRSRSWGEPLHAAAAEERSYFDGSAQQGQSYIYTVTRVLSQVPLVESAAASTREVDYRDRFPPPAPLDLVALAEGDQVRLIWQESLASDRAGYRVYRKGEGGAFEPLLGGELVTSGEHVDPGLAAGHYTYRVTAVDETGNEGDPSPEVSVEVELPGQAPTP